MSKERKVESFLKVTIHAVLVDCCLNTDVYVSCWHLWHRHLYFKWISVAQTLIISVDVCGLTVKVQILFPTSSRLLSEPSESFCQSPEIVMSCLPMIVKKYFFKTSSSPFFCKSTNSENFAKAKQSLKKHLKNPFSPQIERIFDQNYLCQHGYLFYSQL
jgi:hypothetical protein